MQSSTDTDSPRPDWHLRRPFLVAFSVVVVGCSLAQWWLGPALVVALAVYFLAVKYTPFA